MTALRLIDCALALDRAPFFVLGALSPDETAEVREHLASCPEPHPEFLELGGVVPYLAELVEPVDGGPELKRRVMEAIASDVRAQARDDQAAARLVASFGGSRRPTAEVGEAAAIPDMNTTPPPDRSGHERASGLWADEAPYLDSASHPTSIGGRVRSRSMISGWLLSSAAVLLIVVLGAWNVGLQQQAGDAARRADEVAQAIAVSADPSARVARLAGSPAAPDASGFAAFRNDGVGVLVIRGLPPAPSDKTYQAWYLKAGRAESAGLVRVGSDGLLIATGLRPGDLIDGMALTLEVAGGVPQSTQDPLVTGMLTA